MREADFPALPPGYCWAQDGQDRDVVMADKVPDDYRNIDRDRLLVAWVTPRGLVHERSIRQAKHTHQQVTFSQEEGMTVLAMRIWLGMNEP